MTIGEKVGVLDRNVERLLEFTRYTEQNLN